MGFGSQARLNVHLQRHEKQAKRPVLHPTDIDHNEDDVEHIILDAVEVNDLDLVRGFTLDIPRFSEKLLRRAVDSSTCEMLEVLLEACRSEQNIESIILAYATEADNLEATLMLLNRGALVIPVIGEYSCMTYAMMNVSPEMVKILLPYEPVRSPIGGQRYLCSMIPWQPNGFKEARVIQCLDLLRDWTDEKHAFEICFKVNAERCCSIPIAKFLLRSGVSIDTRGHGGHTALSRASTKKNQKAAELMKFLLESGADPLALPSLRAQPVADRPGPRNISKWLGISWEQLVKESRKKHAASLEMKSQ